MRRGGIAYYSGKLMTLILSIIVLSLFVFVISRLAPGDPLVSYYGERVERMTPEQRAAAEERLGLNASIPVQYVRWAKGVINGDLGISYKYKMPVLEVISGRIVNTLILGGLGFIILFVFCLLLGMLCAWFEGSILDKVICRVGTIVSCLPEFWMSLVLILVFSVTLSWLPSSGAYTIGNDTFISRVEHLIMPLTVTVLGHLWYYAYMVRNMLLTEVREDYVLLARAKGLSRRQVMLRHCLRNIMPGYLGIMAIAISHILGGTYVVEMVFSYPGIGTLSYESARFKDYNLLMVLCILTGTLIILSNTVAQIINERIDPRMVGAEKTEVISDEE